MIDNDLHEIDLCDFHIKRPKKWFGKHLTNF